MIHSRCCDAEMRIRDSAFLKTSKERRAYFECKRCGKLYPAYSKDGETWSWENRPAHRPRREAFA